MRVPTWMTCVWPGLPRVWAHGDWSALLWAATFTIVLNLAVIVTFVWPELVSSPIRNTLWLGLAAVWLASTVWSAWRRPFDDLNSRQRADQEAVFVQAQEECLKGEWFQAEGILQKLLRSNPRDVDGRLMLATLMRHTGRLDEADQQLKRLEQLEAAGPWQLEIEREHERIGELADAREPDASDDDEEIDVVTVATDVRGQSAGASEAA
jgi:hypothetical protein